MAILMGYKLTTGQYNAIVNQKFAENQFYNPVKDINGDWFVFEEEAKALKISGVFKNQTPIEYVAPLPIGGGIGG